MTVYNARVSPVNADVITDIKNMLPNELGYTTSKLFFGQVANTSLVDAQEVYTARFTDGTTQTFVVTTDAVGTLIDGSILENYSVAWTSVQFTMLGNMVLMSTGTTPLLYRTSTDTAWTESTSPIMDYCTTALGMVFGVRGKEWFSSGINNPLDWVSTPTNEVSQGILYDLTSDVTGLVTYKDDVVIINGTSTLLGRYIDNTINWALSTIDSDVGGEKIINTGIGVLISSQSFGMNVYAGNLLQPFGLELSTSFKPISLKYVYPYIYCTTPTGAMVYSLLFNAWGNIDFGRQYLTLLTYVREKQTIQSLDTEFSTIDLIPDTALFDVEDTGLPVLGYVSADGDVYASGLPSTETNEYLVQFGIVGSWQIQKLSHVYIALETNNTNHRCYVKYSDTLTLSNSTATANWKYDKFSIVKSAKWFQAVVTGQYTQNDYVYAQSKPELIFNTDNSKRGKHV